MTFPHDLPSSLPGCMIRMTGPWPSSIARTSVPCAELVVIMSTSLTPGPAAEAYVFGVVGETGPGSRHRNLQGKYGRLVDIVQT